MNTSTIRTLVHITLILGLVLAFAMTLLYKIIGASIPLVPKFDDPANGLLYGSVIIYLIALILLGIKPAKDKNIFKIEKQLYSITGAISAFITIMCLI